MAEDLLHVLQARPAHHEVARGRVAEVMEPAGHDPGAREGRLEGRADLAPAPIVAAREEPPAPPLSVQFQCDQGLVDRAPDRDAPRLATPRLEERDPRRREINPLPFEPEDLPFRIPVWSARLTTGARYRLRETRPAAMSLAISVSSRYRSRPSGRFGSTISGTVVTYPRGGRAAGSAGAPRAHSPRLRHSPARPGSARTARSWRR
jgi:hypothetical protein